MVRVLRPSSVAISLFILPSRIRLSTSRSPGESLLSRSSARCRRATRRRVLRVQVDRLADAVPEPLLLDGLLQEVDGAHLHRFDGHRHVAVTGDEDDRKRDLVVDEPPLQVPVRSCPASPHPRPGSRGDRGGRRPRTRPPRRMSRRGETRPSRSSASPATLLDRRLPGKPWLLHSRGTTT